MPHDRSLPGEHPRLLFTPRELARLRSQRDQGKRGDIWRNLDTTARWCLTQPIRARWIAPVEPDPIYENLYERFYGMMRDMALAEHLAFAYAFAPDGADRDRYFEAARAWALALCATWSREAEGDADASKAYAVTRLLKGVAVGYDLLFDRLSPGDRDTLRHMLVTVGGKYDAFFRDPKHAFGDDYEPHHGSVEAASMGLVALALIGDAPEARGWLDFMTERHVNWLLPRALTRSGTHNQTSNFWISIMQYRIAFMDALRRVTGRDLFREFERDMPWSVPLSAAVASESPANAEYREANQTWLWGPDYGQIDYASPALVGLAREYRQPILRRLAELDGGLGSLQKTRYVCKGEQMLFAWGGYALAWWDETVPEVVEPAQTLSWLFNDPHPSDECYMNEAYARAGFEPGDIALGVRRGDVVIHAGGRPVFVDFTPAWPPRRALPDLSLGDESGVATIRCTGGPESGYAEQTVTLARPGRAVIERRGVERVRWWMAGRPTREGNVLRWPDGTTLRAVTGTLTEFDPLGHTEPKITGMGKLPLIDPWPVTYPTARVQADANMVRLEIARPH